MPPCVQYLVSICFFAFFLLSVQKLFSFLCEINVHDHTDIRQGKEQRFMENLFKYGVMKNKNLYLSLSIYILYISRSILLSISLSIRLTISLSFYSSLFLPFFLSFYLSINLSLYPSIYISIYI